MALILAEANRMLQAAIAQAEALNIKLSIAVVDAGGHLMAFNRMEGANWITARSCTSILRVIPSPAHQVQYPHFTTCVRGLCHGITPVFLPAHIPGAPLALRHAALCLAKRVYRRGSEAIRTSAAAVQAFQRPEAVSWPHPQAPLCRL